MAATGRCVSSPNVEGGWGSFAGRRVGLVSLELRSAARVVSDASQVLQISKKHRRIKPESGNGPITKRCDEKRWVVEPQRWIVLGGRARRTSGSENDASPESKLPLCRFGGGLAQEWGRAR